MVVVFVVVVLLLAMATVFGFSVPWRGGDTGVAGEFLNTDVATDDSAPSMSKSIAPASDMRDMGVMAAHGGDVSPAAESAVMYESDVAASEKKEMKDGDITMRVHDAERAMTDIAAIVAQHGGEVISSTLYQDTSDVKQGVVQVRVPVHQFDGAFAAVKTVATLVEFASVSGEDVTMEYRDLQARIKNLQAEEQTYVRLLDRAEKMSDVISITRQLSRVRGDIERLQTQIVYMESQTDYAGITVSLKEDENVTFSDQWRPMQIAKEAVNGLFADAQKFVNVVIVFILRVLPVAVLYGIVLYVFYALVRAVARAARRKKPTV